MMRMSRHPAGWLRRRPRCSAMVLALVLACPATPSGAQAQAPADACEESLADMFDRVSPAVVSIGATSINPYRLSERVSHVARLGRDRRRGRADPHQLARGVRQAVAGRDAGRRRRPARLVGADPIFDVAVIQIPKPTKGTLPVLKLGDSGSLREGEDVIAIGNPLGLDQTVTRGIVSGLNRLLQDTPFSLQEPLIQTDAPINPGNSGGRCSTAAAR